jgi:hypothetical protein
MSHLFCTIVFADLITCRCLIIKWVICVAAVYGACCSKQGGVEGFAVSE